MTRRSDKAKVTAIVPSAGKGARFSSKENKILARLNKKPLLLYSLKVLESSPLVEDVVLVVDAGLMEAAGKLVRRHNIAKVTHIVKGGRTRSESVKRGLSAISRDTSFVLVHDGARPLVNKEIIRKTVAAAKRFGAAVAAVPVKSTIKVSGRDSFVKYTPDRRYLWEAQTPQVFRKSILEDAYKRLKATGSFTDDTALIENMGKKVKIVKSDYNNIKVTTAEDIKIAEVLLDGE
ncbi:MAG: 2-C-methyl-D-erythritol 4-phosphate cytidylyltransferase [Candidatus Omnitrophica bacterium]|nr:2-C-methyl-D-erythritol 4-phosphate cytidylyltransferase [Candidatus Omnitrophota bacterium]